MGRLQAGFRVQRRPLDGGRAGQSMRKGFWLGLACLLLACACFQAVGADAGTPDGSLDLFALVAPSFTTFGVRDGLPDPVTVTVRTDRSGFVWVGTQHGLAWYDGQRWHRLDDPALSGYVDQLFLDHEGTLWAASRAFGLARYDGVRWHLVGAAEGLATHRVRRLVETPYQGATRLWALTWDAGVWFLDHGRWHADPGNAQLLPGAVMALVATTTLGGQPRLWVGSGVNGLWYRDGAGPWRRFQTDGFDPADVESLLVTHDGHCEALWISAFGQGLWRLDDHGLRAWNTESGTLSTDMVYNLVEAPAPGGGSAVWAASRAGLVRIYRDQASVFDRGYGLPADAVRGISYWRSPGGDEVLWLATEDGVARTIIGGRAWTTASLLGANDIGVFGTLVDHDADGNARLWVASWGGGLGLYARGQWRYFTHASRALPSSDVRLVKHADDLQGHPALWITTRFGNVLRVREGPRFEPVPTPWPHDAGQVVEDLLGRRVDGQVEQWFATSESGIYRRRADGWTAYRPSAAKGAWRVSALLAQHARDGRDWLWAATNQGLARFDGTGWALLGRSAGLPSLDLLDLSLLDDRHGRPILWVGSEHSGVIRLDVTDPSHPRVLPADLPLPPDPSVYGALRDAHGDVYLCTNAGVQLLHPDPQGYSSRVFTTADGLINDECNAGAQFIDARGRFWTGTLGGLSVYDPTWERADHTAKPLRLLRVSIDDRSVSGAPVVVPPGRHSVRVDFALLSWRQESGSRFRTWLEGLDAHPGAWNADASRDLGVLPPGHFKLHIEARDYAGNLSTPIVLPITVRPRWWQTALAKAAFALAVVLAFYLVLQARTRVLRLRQRVLESGIEARTAELNAANRKLSELARHDALTGLFNRRQFMDALAQGIAAPGTWVALILLDVDLFKHYNDTWGHPAGDVALRAVADAMRTTAPADATVARYGGEEFVCLIPRCNEARELEVADAIRRAVAAAPVPVPGQEGAVNRITVSAGVAARPLASPVEAPLLLHDADVALYRAKGDGRDCVRGTARPAAWTRTVTG